MPESRAGSKIKSGRPGAALSPRCGLGVYPANDDVCSRIYQLQSKKPDRVSVRTVATTPEGRPIDAVTVTDPDFPDHDKQHVLIVAGQHGNEESARLVALRTLDYLLGADGRPLLKRQKFVVMPNVSPDAADRDAYETPAGIKPNLDHAASGPVSAEAKALETIANELQPELYVDLHARGHAGCSHDMVLFPPAKPYTEDEAILHAIASEMAAEGERSGIPHLVHPLTWPGWGGHDLDQPSSTLWMYRQFKSMVFLTENSEHNEFAYPEKTRARAGVGRLKPLLAMGNRRHPRLYYPGYPCGCAAGMFNAGVVAVGVTAAVRRASRVAIWRNAAGFQSLSAAIPEKPAIKTLQIDYRGPTIRAGVGFQARVANRLLVKQITINGTRQRPDEVNGYYTWQDKHTTFAVVAMPELTPGQYEIAFAFQ